MYSKGKVFLRYDKIKKDNCLEAKVTGESFDISSAFIFFSKPRETSQMINFHGNKLSVSKWTTF